jgi:glycosyltransferase involved in cell wall biosynthesis
VLGALVPWKRADLALEVAVRLPALRLELAGAPLPGDGDDFARALRERAAAPDLAGRVTFSGALADPRTALARAHLLLHCADAEPFGMVLLEALASGRPVAAPAAAGPLEIVPDGAGRLFAPGDADAGARAVEALLAAPPPPETARAAAARFPVEASAARFEATIEAIAR